MVCLLVSMYQCTHLYITSNDHSGIGPLLVNKHRLSLKSDPTLQAPNSLSDPDRIPLTYVSVMFTDYRSAFSPTHSCCLPDTLTSTGLAYEMQCPKSLHLRSSKHHFYHRLIGDIIR